MKGENTEKTAALKEQAKEKFCVCAGVGGAMLGCYMLLCCGYKLGNRDGIKHVLNALKAHNPEESAKFIQYCMENNL